MTPQDLQLDEDGFPAFEPVRIYDAPATILTQIFDGEGSLSRAARTFFDQESLSPAERDSYAQRLKTSYGGNPVTNTAIDLATNPLVWFLALTSPIGRKQFAATGGKLLSGLSEMRKGTGASKFAVNIAQMLRVPGLTGLISSTETQAPAMLLQTLASNLKKLREEEARFISVPRGNLMKKLGVTDLDASRSDNPVLQELNRLLHYWESGYAERGTALNRRFVSTVVGKVQVVDKGNVVGNAEPMILSRSAMDQLRRDPSIKSSVATNLNLSKGQQFKLGDVTYQLADEAVFVNNEDTLQRARAFFPKAAKGEAWGKYKDMVKYIGLEDDIAQTMHIVGLDKDAILGWARSNNIEKEFLEYVTASSRMRDHFKKRLFGKMNPDGSVPDVFELDPNKVIRYYTRHQKTKGSADSIAERVAMQEILGADFFSAIDDALPTWVKSAVRTGSHRVKLSDVEDVLHRMLTPQLESPYLPRNTSKVMVVDKNGQVVTQGPTAIDALSRRRSPGFDLDQIESIVLPREKTELFYDPDDLVALGNIAQRHGRGGPNVMVFEPGAALDAEAVPLASMIDRTRAIVRDRISNRESISMLSMDHELSIRKYMRDAQATITLHGTDMPEHMKSVLQNAIKTPAPRFRGAYSPTAVKYDEDKIRSQLEFLGLRPEDLKYLEPAGAILQEEVAANPALVRWRQKIASLRNTARTSTGKRKTQLLNDAKKLESQLEGVAVDLQMRDVALLNPELDRRVSMGEALRVVLSRESLEVQEQFAKHLLPHMFGGSKPAQLLGLRANQEVRLMASRFANSGMGKWLEGSSDIGRNFITSVRDYSSKTGYELDAAYRTSGLTGYLYATHLGFNAASAMWNAMQPLQWAATWMGGREVLGAYGSALKQLGAYTKERIAKHGFGPMDPLARRELWLKHIPTAGKGTGGRDLLGLSDDVVSTLDAALISAPVGEKPSMLKYLTVDMPLKLFQKAEELNRIVVAEAGLKWYNRMSRETGVRMTADEVFDQVSIMQSLVNFNPNPSTQLRIFQEGGLLSNPMMRMFLQYPMRSVSNILVGQQLGGGVREVGFGAMKFEAPAFIADTGRLLGTGAVIYEIGKNMANLDLSSGLGAAALTQLPGQITVAGALPMPPVVDIPLKLVNSLVEQDREAFRQVAFRLVPGGLAIQKALGSLPAIPGGGNFGVIQSQYADWTNKNEQGMVPVYNSDGMLQGFESPLALVMRGVGADFKKHQSPQEATRFLLANRAAMVDLRRKYKDAVLGNNMTAAQSIEAEYRKRYGVPMTVKPGEWDRAIEMRQTTVSERMLDTMPEDVRGAYQQSLQGAPFATAMGLPVGGLAQGETARQRASIRGFNVDVVNPAEGQ